MQTFCLKDLQIILVLVLALQIAMPTPRVWANDPPPPPSELPLGSGGYVSGSTEVQTLPPHVREIVQKIQRCQQLPVCGNNAATPRAGAFRGSAHPCQLTEEEQRQLLEFFLHIPLNGRHSFATAMTLGILTIIEQFATREVLSHFSPSSISGFILGVVLIVALIPVNIGFNTLITGRLADFFRSRSMSRALQAEGVNPTHVMRELRRIPRQSWIRDAWAATRARLRALASARPNAGSPVNANPNASTTTTTAAPPSNNERTGVRIQFGDNPDCVPQTAVQAAALGAAQALEEAAEAEGATPAGGRQAAAHGPAPGSESRVASGAESTSHLCTPQRVQQYAHALAVDRATRWQEFSRRLNQNNRLMTFENTARFQEAQRRDLMEGSAAVAGAIVGGVLICGSGGTATPLVTVGQQFFTRGLVNATAAVALAAGTVSLLPAEASAQEIAEAHPQCNLNAPRVALPQSEQNRAYMGIPASYVNERRSVTASYQPPPLCWAPAAETCAALRQEFANSNISRLTPSVCGSLPTPAGPNSSATTIPLSGPSQGAGAH